MLDAARVQCDYGNCVIVSIAKFRTTRVKHVMTGRAVLHVITLPLEAYAGEPRPAGRYSLGRLLINQQKAAATECPESSPIQPSGEQVGKVSG
jgi:hypothetical protein